MELSTNVILGLAIIGMSLCGLSLFIETRVVEGSRHYLIARKVFWVGLLALLCAPLGVICFEIGQQVVTWLNS